MPAEQPLDDLKKWISSMAERGLYPKTTARFRLGAIEALTSVLGDDELQDLSAILENLEELGKRWATLKHANPTTASTYVSRARTGLEDYLQYKENPSSFKGRRRKTKPKSAKPKPAPKAAVAKKGSPLSTPATEASRPVPRVFPIAQDQDFKYFLPADGITVVDALRVFYHLVTLARDFDPTDPKQAQIFSLVRKQP